MPDLLPFLGEIALRSSLVLAATFACLLAMTRASASERHLVLLLALLMTALVPAGLLVTPKVTWTITLPHQLESSPPPQRATVRVLPENENSTSTSPAPVVESKPSLTDFCTVTNGLIALFAGGMLMQVAMLGRAVWTWRRIGRRAEKALLPEDVLEEARIFAGVRIIPPIFTSDQITVPLLSGWLQPSIILPSQAARWPVQRLRMALCHELAHFKRGDSLLTPLICSLRVFYWWHPLVWLGLARLRRERENACDDLVLNQNFRATDYADLIVFTARQAQALRWQDGALAMASSSNVGERIGAILNPRLNRRPTSRTTIFTVLILTFGIGWFFVAAQVQAEDQPAASNSTAATNASKPQIQLEFKLVQIDEKTYISHQKQIDEEMTNFDLVSLINLINNLPGASLLSAPSVTTQEGLKATVDIVREMPYATKFDKDKDGKIVPSDFKTRDVGLSIEVTPTLTADKQYVRLKFKCKLTSFEGWKEVPTGGRLPIFDTASIETERLIGKHGDAVWVGKSGATRAYLTVGNGNNGPPSTNDTASKRILLLISARPVPAATRADAGTSATDEAAFYQALERDRTSVADSTVKVSTLAADAQMLLAIQKGDVPALKQVLEHAVAPNKFDPDRFHSCPVYWAVYFNQPEILKLLLEHLATGDLGPANETPLRLAQRKHPDLVPIIEEGINRNRVLLTAKLTESLHSIHIDLPAFSNAPLNQLTKFLLDDATTKAGYLERRITVGTMDLPPSTTITSPARSNISIWDALQTIADANKLRFDVDGSWPGGITLYPPKDETIIHPLPAKADSVVPQH